MAARSEAGGDVQFHVFTEFVFLPCRLEAVNRDSHVALVHAPTAASIAYVDLCFHGDSPKMAGRSDTFSNVIIVVDWNPNVGLLGVLNFNTVRVALVPALEYTYLGELTNVGVNRVTNLESKVFSNACLEAFLESLMIEVAPDKHETAFTHFVFFPKTNVFLEITTEKLSLIHI